MRICICMRIRLYIHVFIHLYIRTKYGTYVIKEKTKNWACGAPPLPKTILSPLSLNKKIDAPTEHPPTLLTNSFKY